MPNEMTAAEAVKRLEGLENKFNPTKEIYVSDKEWSTIMVAASLLRRIVAGEYGM